MQPASNPEDTTLDALLTAHAPRSLHAHDAGEADDAAHVDDADLLAYGRGHLAEADAEGIERHLVACAECRALLVLLQRPVSASGLRAAEQVFEVGASRAAAPSPAAPVRSRAWVRWVGPVVLAAAAVLAIVVHRDHPDFDWVAGYQADTVGGALAEIRSAGAPEVEPVGRTRRFNVNSTLTWVLRPVDAAPPGVLTLWVAPAGGRLQKLAAPVERTPEGVFSVRGRAADLLGPDFGEKVLVAALGNEAVDLEGREATADALTLDPDEGVLFRAVVRYVQEPK